MILVLSLLLSAAPPPPTFPPSAEERAELEKLVADLASAVDRIPAGHERIVADVTVCLKAGRWALKYPDEFFTKQSVAQTRRVLKEGLRRAASLGKLHPGARPDWCTDRAASVHGYRSMVDGSIQPFAIVYPKDFAWFNVRRIDLVLHGRDSKLSEVSFLARHLDARPKSQPKHLELHVYGRGNNAYRWAGETDVFEALEAMKGMFPTSGGLQVVLRGFSMGGAGAWHLGLHFPDRWAAVEAGAGFVDTVVHASLKSVPKHIAPALHIYDSLDVASNATQTPFVGYGGEIDKQLFASQAVLKNLEGAGMKFRKEGMNSYSADHLLAFLVGPKTAHQWHKDSKRKSDELIDQWIAKPKPAGARIDFVTYTSLYGSCRWLAAEALEREYERAELHGSVEGGVAKIATRNVRRLTVTDCDANTIVIDDQPMKGGLPFGESATFQKSAGRWKKFDPDAVATPVKDFLLRGPIDDAFRTRFICIPPSSEGANPAATAAARRWFERFQREWSKWMRGDLPVKQADAVTEVDFAESNLILFGDPTNNPFIARIATTLPIQWRDGSFTLAGEKFSDAQYLPTLIHPNPIGRRYVVLNSGHTFHDADFIGTNALLYPRLGDFAALPLDDKAAPKGIGYFDSDWKFPTK